MNVFSPIERTQSDLSAGIPPLFVSLDETLHVVTFETSGRATEEMMRRKIDFAVPFLFSDWSSAPDTRLRQAAPDLPTV